ncbi:MAG: hypothetical protein M0030_02995 [Actinomycetota bacterium]|nr:hypothetical protein [Actinomycetota bacterium]
MAAVAAAWDTPDPGLRRSATDALEAIRVALPRGRRFVFGADIRDFFRQIDQDRLG